MAGRGRGRRRAVCLLGSATALLAGGLGPMASAQAAPDGPTPHTVVAKGLANPRGVDVGAAGAVFVAESGAGGTTRATATVHGEPETVCVGRTGGVTAVVGGVQLRVATLPSFAGAQEGTDGKPTCAGTGSEAVGPSDVAAGGGRLAVTIGLGASPAARAQLPAGLRADFGTVRYVGPSGPPLADLAAFEQSANPIGELDTNPYGIARTPSGSYLVADAGGNDLLRIDTSRNATRRVGLVATFPNLPARPFVPPSCAGSLPPGAFPPAGTPIPPEAVPTAVEVGSNGTYYVGFLSGFPFHKGAARVVRVSPTGRTSVLAEGLTQVVGLDFAPDRSLYVLELSTASLLEGACGKRVPGDVVRIDGRRRTVIARGLPAPGGIAVAPDGSFYVSVNSTSPRTGEVWRFPKPRS